MGNTHIKCYQKKKSQIKNQAASQSETKQSDLTKKEKITYIDKKNYKNLNKNFKQKK